MKKIICTILVLSMIPCTLISTLALGNGIVTGNNPFTGYVITAETEAFCIEQFQKAHSPEHLASLVIDFALKHFTYDMSYMTSPQTLDVNRFIFKNNFHGVCADYAVFVNTALQVVSKHRGWDHMSTHMIFCIDTEQRSGHMFNYMSVRQPDGSVMVYEIDTTWDQVRYQRGMQIQGIHHHYRVDSEADIPTAVRILYAYSYSAFDQSHLF